MTGQAEGRALQPRSLGDILNETFIIYGRRFPRFLLLVGVVQGPLSLLALLPGGGIAGWVAAVAVTLFATACVYGAVVWAVGQHYVKGEISIASCYSRVGWRVMSLAVVSGILAVSLAVDVLLMVFVVPALILSVYIFLCLGLTVSAVMMEGQKPRGALDRIFKLLNGSWLRVLGIGTVVLLLTIGLALVLVAPFALASVGVGSTAGEILLTIAGVVVTVGVTPVAAISLTLIYYDLRVRKEDYDLVALSREMGLVPA